MSNLYEIPIVEKTDIFYYVYALFHSKQYKRIFKNNLSKESPRIFFPQKLTQFMEYSNKGKKLADLHLNYEEAEIYPVLFQKNFLINEIEDSVNFFKVTKMKFINKNDKSRVFFNNNITLEEIPLKAYEYVVNGKPALEWVMDRYCIKTDKNSGIINNANDFANETIDDPKYPLELFQRVITVSLETIEIVNSFSELDIES